MSLLIDFLTGFSLLLAIGALALWVWATAGCRPIGPVARCPRCGSRWHPDCTEPRR